jgi:general secretion pathway protein D
VCRSCGVVCVALTLIAVLLAACNQLITSQLNSNANQGHDSDVVDRIRSIDLLPRPLSNTDPPDPSAKNRARAIEVRGAEVAAGSPQRPDYPSSGEGFELNFENTPVASVAKVVIGDILGLGYSIDPRVQGTVNLSSGRPVPKSDILYVLENALRLSGVVIIREAAGYRLVPLGDAVGAGKLDVASARAEPGYGISVVPLQYVSAQTLMKLLDSFATRPGTVRADNARNLLLIQGSGADRRTAIDTVLSFDVDWMRGQSVGVYPVQYSSPEPVIAELEKIFDSGDSGFTQGLVKFQPVVRMNAILVVTRKPDLLRAAANWIHRLDTADSTRNGVHVYHVQYGDARQIARVLTDLFIGGASNNLDSAAAQIAPGSGVAATSSADRLAAAGQAANAGAAQGGAGAGGSATGFGARQTAGGGFGGRGTGLDSANPAAANAADGRGGASFGGPPIMPGVRITADVVNNSVVIYAGQDSYPIIERTLRQLDRPQLQVAIDATVAEVTLNDNLSYGVQFFLQSQYFGVKPGTGSISNIPASPPGQPSTNSAGLVGAALNRAFPGFNFLVGSEASPNVILDALHAVTDLRVLSNPSLVVVDNQVATLSVGDDVPISTGSASVLNSATATSNTIVNTIDYRSTGIIIRILPRVSANGNVRLDIEQEISQVANASTTSTTPNLTPTISQRKVKSTISVANGQTVLLAGLIQSQKEIDRSGIPYLNQIPVLGDALSHQNKTAMRTELIIFIRPQVIRDGVDAHYVAEELRSKLRGSIDAVANGPPASQKLR